MRGLVVSLNTPFDNWDRIDWDALGRLVELHLAEGAAGFLTPAQAAEVHLLAHQERVDLIRAVRDQTGNRAIVIAGATSESRRDSLRLAEAAVGMDCDGVLSEPPAGTMSAEDLLQYFKGIAALGPRLLMIQDLDWNGTGMPVPLIRRLFDEIDCFRALKVEVNPAGPKYTAVLEATGNRLEVSGGWAALQMIEALDRGVGVFMNTAFTRVYRAIMDAHARGDRALSRERFHRLLPVLAFTRQSLEISIVFHKRFFHHRGVFTTSRCRKPCALWDRWHEIQTRELLEYADRLVADAARWDQGLAQE